MIPQNFADIWKKYLPGGSEYQRILDTLNLGDDPRVNSALVSSRMNAERERALMAAGMTQQEIRSPSQQLSDQLNTLLGGSALQKPQGLLDNSQPQQGEVAGADKDGNPIWINNKTKAMRPRGLIDQSTGKPFAPPKDATAAGKTTTTTAGGGTTTTTGSGTTTTSGGKGLPITAGEYDDYMAQAKSVMSRAGIVSREPSDAEIVQFAQGKMNFDSIDQFYRNLPEFVSQQPGLPYNLSKTDYEAARREMQASTKGMFDTPDTGTGAGTESAYVSEALKEKMSPAELQAGLADQFKRLGGKQPTAADVAAIRTRPKITTEEDRAGAATTVTDTGPTQSRLGTQTSSPFARKR